MTVRELIFSLLINNELDDTVEVETCTMDTVNDVPANYNWSSPKRVSRIDLEGVALIECIREEKE